jgi:hypothetical protein
MHVLLALTEMLCLVACLSLATFKKSNLMADLFGDQASKPARSIDVESDDIFKPPVRNTKINLQNM